jgi:type III restriction enzyme
LTPGEYWRELSQTPLFGELEEQSWPFEGAPDAAGHNVSRKPYVLRKDLGIPDALIREVAPQPWEMPSELVKQIAAEFLNDALPLREILQRKRKAKLSLRDLFLSDGDEETQDISMLMSNAREISSAKNAA